MPVWTAEAATCRRGGRGGRLRAAAAASRVLPSSARRKPRRRRGTGLALQGVPRGGASGVVVANGIRINHATCATTASCTDCHSSTAHGSATDGFDPTTWMAASSAIWRRATSRAICVTRAGTACVRVKSSAFAVTHGPQWKTTHGMGDNATCTVCHTAPTAPTVMARACRTAELRRGPFDVRGCNGGASASPATRTRSATPATGRRCRTRQDSRRSTRAASKKQPDLCPRCHDESDCTNCHVKHVHPGGAVGTARPGGGGQ